MSPRSILLPASETVERTVARLTVQLGMSVRDERRRRGWTLAHLARSSGMSVSRLQSLEAGQAGSIEAYARAGSALGLRPEFLLSDARRRTVLPRADNPVHSAMGECEAAHLRGLGFPVSIDEPYQHYRFSGRADVLAWDLERRALLHHENRTRFPNLQEVAGSFNAKVAYLAPVIAERLGIRGGFRSVTHVMVVLWSAEALHSLRLRAETFRSLCPDPSDAFEGWWSGRPPEAGQHRTLVVFDPVPATPRRAIFRGFDQIATLRPRYAGYREVVEALARRNR